MKAQQEENEREMDDINKTHEEKMKMAKQEQGVSELLKMFDY